MSSAIPLRYAIGLTIDNAINLRAGDHCAQCSTGSHCADNAFKNPRIHLSLSSNQSRSQHSSDSEHFTGKVANVLSAPSQLLAPDVC